jgi:hypothetical protein
MKMNTTEQPQQALKQTLEQYADASNWRTQSYEQKICALRLFYEKLVLILWAVNMGKHTIVKHDHLNSFYFVLKEAVASLLQQKEFAKLQKKSPSLYEDVLIEPYKASQQDRISMHLSAFTFYSEIEKLFNQTGSLIPDSHVSLKEILNYLIDPMVIEYRKVIQRTEPNTLSPEMSEGKEVAEFECGEDNGYCKLSFRDKKVVFRSKLRCSLLDFFFNDKSMGQWLTYHEMPRDILLVGNIGQVRKAIKKINEITDNKIGIKLIAVRGHEDKSKKMPNQYRSIRY